MGTIIYPIYTLASLILLIWGINSFRRWGTLANALLLFVLATFVYDNLIVSLGTVIGAGTFLQGLSLLRYILESIATPLLLLITIELARQASLYWVNNVLLRYVSPAGATRAGTLVLSWANNALLRYGSWVPALILIIYGLSGNLAGLDPEPALLDGNLRYMSVHSTLPVLLGFSTVLVALAGALIWRTVKLPWIFLAALLGLLSSAVPGRAAHFLTGTASQLLLVAAMLVTLQAVYSLRNRQPSRVIFAASSQIT